MKRIKNILWWICFLYFGIVLQFYITNLDALIVGILIATEEREYKILVWLVPLVIILQEGMGSQCFGQSLLYVVSFFALYRIWMPLASASKPIFIIVLSLSLGAMRGVLIWLFCILQIYPFNMDLALHDSIIQAIYIPVAWSLLSYLRRSFRQVSYAQTHEND